MNTSEINKIGQSLKHFTFNKDQITASLIDVLSAINCDYIHQTVYYNYCGKNYYISLLVPENLAQNKYYHDLPSFSLILDIGPQKTSLKNEISFWQVPDKTAQRIAHASDVLYFNFNMKNDNHLRKDNDYITQQIIYNNLKHFIYYLVDYRLTENCFNFDKETLETLKNYYILNNLPGINSKIKREAKTKHLIRRKK